MKNKGISQGSNGFGTPNKVGTVAYYKPFQSLESEHHESAYYFQMKFCDLSPILWEQVSYVSCMCKKIFRFKL